MCFLTAVCGLHYGSAYRVLYACPWDTLWLCSQSKIYLPGEREVMFLVVLVCLSVCLFLSNITQNVMNRLRRNSIEGLGVLYVCPWFALCLCSAECFMSVHGLCSAECFMSVHGLHYGCAHQRALCVVLLTECFSLPTV